MSRSPALHAVRSRAYSVSCVVPVFNGSAAIASFLNRLYDILAKQCPDIELIVVNDGSTDDSEVAITQLCNVLPIHYIELSRSFGKEVALQAGLDAAIGDCVLTVDMHCQCELEVIPALVDRWLAGAELVYAVTARQSQSWSERLASRVLHRVLQSQGGAQIPRNTCDLRLFDQKVVEALQQMPERNRFMKGLCAWVGFKVETVEVFSNSPNQDRFQWRHFLTTAIAGMTSFSNLPLRYVTGGGFVVSFAAFCMGAWLVIEKLFFHQPIVGFTTTATAIFLLSGIQLIAIGVVGEYIGRIFDEVKQRPQYVVTKESNAQMMYTQTGDECGHRMATNGQRAAARA